MYGPAERADLLPLFISTPICTLWAHSPAGEEVGVPIRTTGEKPSVYCVRDGKNIDKVAYKIQEKYEKNN